MREVAAQCEKPVMLYSIGKDSAVMLHLAMKAFYPAKPPFPLLHVDTTWKFRAMIEFRDNLAKELGFDLLVHINEDGVKAGVNPFSVGSAKHTDIMKTEALKQALDKYGFDAAFGGARRDEEKSRAKERIFSFRNAQHRWDPKNQRPELWRTYNTRINKGRVDARLPAVQLDRAGYLAVHPRREHTHRAALLRCRAPRCAPRQRADHGG
jgi:sulfate adenylyltransferase subunit 2